MRSALVDRFENKAVEMATMPQQIEYSGNRAVDEVTRIHWEGNIKPISWNMTILLPNGKPDRLAQDILAEVVYWYRAVIVRDEQNPNRVTWRKKFKADLLQMSYTQLQSLFGESKKTIQRALANLERLGVIKRIFKTIKTPNFTMGNVMYIAVNPDVLFDLTYPKMPEAPEPYSFEADVDLSPVAFEADDPDYEIVDEIASEDVFAGESACAVRGDTPMDKSVQRVEHICPDITETTTETTYPHPIPTITGRLSDARARVSSLDWVDGVEDKAKGKDGIDGVGGTCAREARRRSTGA